MVTFGIYNSFHKIIKIPTEIVYSTVNPFCTHFILEFIYYGVIKKITRKSLDILNGDFYNIIQMKPLGSCQRNDK